MSKVKLRPLLQNKRKDFFKEADHAHIAQSILSHLSTLPLPKVIGAYWPIKSELDLKPVLEALKKNGHTIALPYCSSKTDMAFYEMDDLAPDAQGIPAPDPKSPQLYPEAYLVPCLGFDESCNRLGYGAGHYDRYFAKLSKQPLKIGIAFEIQKTSLFKEDHDIPLDMIVTEDKIYR